ncbi:unnamed protein product [Echinostoma caproni]|uniref:Aminopeptidase N n=1 Tax=Echinostoma caproni TaxID=27848 RepID=A0A183BB85_9TREM|nr:unnamed protein product [Echinostoma caproni]
MPVHSSSPPIRRVFELLTVRFLHFSFQWQIPLTYGTPTTSNWEDNEVIWLKDKSMTTELDIEPSAWYVFNTKQAGFYRVHYADSNWEALTKQLIADHKTLLHHRLYQPPGNVFRHPLCQGPIRSADVSPQLKVNW